MDTLGWTGGATRGDGIRNKYVRGSIGVASMYWWIGTEMVIERDVMRSKETEAGKRKTKEEIWMETIEMDSMRVVDVCVCVEGCE